MTVGRFPIASHRDVVRGWNTIAKSQDTHGFGSIFLKRYKWRIVSGKANCVVLCLIEHSQPCNFFFSTLNKVLFLHTGSHFDQGQQITVYPLGHRTAADKGSRLSAADNTMTPLEAKETASLCSSLQFFMLQAGVLSSGCLLQVDLMQKSPDILKKMSCFPKH